MSLPAEQQFDGAPAAVDITEPSSKPQPHVIVGEPSPTLSTSSEIGSVLRCTWKTCTAKAEDRTFMGKGAKSAHRRHMDTHVKPYTCPQPSCDRHKRGFSRKDNLNIHLRSHWLKSQRSANLGENQELRRIERNAQRDLLKHLIQTANKLMRHMDSDPVDEDLENMDISDSACGSGASGGADNVEDENIDSTAVLC